MLHDETEESAVEVEHEEDVDHCYTCAEDCNDECVCEDCDAPPQDSHMDRSAWALTVTGVAMISALSSVFEGTKAFPAWTTRDTSYLAMQIAYRANSMQLSNTVTLLESALQVRKRLVKEDPELAAAEETLRKMYHTGE